MGLVGKIGREGGEKSKAISPIALLAQNYTVQAHT